MNPDQLFHAFMLILYDVFGKEELWKDSAATPQQLADVEERTKCLFAMNRSKVFDGGTNGSPARGKKTEWLPTARKAKAHAGAKNKANPEQRWDSEEEGQEQGA